jgi:hypothetical protein
MANSESLALTSRSPALRGICGASRSGRRWRRSVRTSPWTRRTRSSSSAVCTTQTRPATPRSTSAGVPCLALGPATMCSWPAMGLTEPTRARSASMATSSSSLTPSWSMLCTRAASRGASRAPIDFGGGPLTDPSFAPHQGFVASLDADGNHRRSRKLTGTDHVAPQSIAIDALSRVLVAGTFKGSPGWRFVERRRHDVARRRTPSEARTNNPISQAAPLFRRSNVLHPQPFGLFGSPPDAVEMHAP